MTRPLTSVERALETLREEILRGALSAGDRLAEGELAEGRGGRRTPAPGARRRGVSRTPVREALSRLSAEGLVELAPNRGARVATWTVDELEGVFALRMSLEPQLTGFAVAHAGPADVEALDELARRMHAVGSPGPDQD